MIQVSINIYIVQHMFAILYAYISYNIYIVQHMFVILSAYVPYS